MNKQPATLDSISRHNALRKPVTGSEEKEDIKPGDIGWNMDLNNGTKEEENNARDDFFTKKQEKNNEEVEVGHSGDLSQQI